MRFSVPPWVLPAARITRPSSTRITFKTPRDENSTKTLWAWNDADWAGLRRCLAQQKWEELLKRDVNKQVERFTEVLLRAQKQWVPHKQHTTKASDQPWPQCRLAAQKKNIKHPKCWNKERHRFAVSEMETTQTWAREQWVEDKKRRSRGGQVGSKQCQGQSSGIE